MINIQNTGNGKLMVWLEQPPFRVGFSACLIIAKPFEIIYRLKLKFPV